MNTQVPEVGPADIAGLEKALQVVRNEADRQFLAFLIQVASRKQPTEGLLP